MNTSKLNATGSSEDPKAQPVNGTSNQSNGSNPTGQGSSDQGADPYSASNVIDIAGKLSKNSLYLTNLLETCNDNRNGCPLTPRFSAKFLLAQLLKAGYKLAFDTENREIYGSQVKALYEDVKDRPGKCFTEPAKIVSARTLLEMGKKLVDADGIALTLETPDIDLYNVVLDGQHRTLVCMLHNDIDLWMEVVDLGAFSSEQYYVVLNNLRKNHTGGDQKHMLQQMFAGKTPLIEAMVKFKKEFGVTDKYAEGILTYKVDQFKKSELAKYQSGEKEVGDKFKLDQSKVDLAWAVWDIIKANYGSDKDKLKRFKKYQFAIALGNVYNGLTDDEQKTYKEDICSFLKFGFDSAIESVLDNIDDKEKLTSMLNRQLKMFLKAQTEDDKTAHEKEVYDLLAVTNTSRNATPTPNPNSKVKALASGSFADVLKNLQELATQKAEAAKKKAQAKLDKDAVKMNEQIETTLAETKSKVKDNPGDGHSSLNTGEVEDADYIEIK